MSQENVELVRAAFEDFLAGKAEFDTEGLLTKLPSERHWDPDIEWDAPEGLLPDIGGVYRGKEAVRGFWREWLAAWEIVQFEYELVDAGDRVVALIDQRMRGRSTGIGTPFGKYAHVLTLRNGLVRALEGSFVAKYHGVSRRCISAHASSAARSMAYAFSWSLLSLA